MKLQKGNFIINSMDELDNVPMEKDGIKKIIDLEYMGQFEYEGNAIPISRMFIEYYKEDYYFYPTQIFNKEGHQMYIYANSDSINKKLKKNPKYISDLAKYNIEQNYSLHEYVNNNPEECFYDFWWNIESDYFILFGEEKQKLVNFFINQCDRRDGGKEMIKTKLLKIGYKL